MPVFYIDIYYIYDITCFFFKSSEWLQENKGGTQEGEGNKGMCMKLYIINVSLQGENHRSDKI